jgi:hypothetical protein
MAGGRFLIVKFSIWVAEVDLLLNCQLVRVVGGRNGLVTLQANRIDRTIAVFPSGKRVITWHINALQRVRNVQQKKSLFLIAGYLKTKLHVIAIPRMVTNAQLIFH